MLYWQHSCNIECNYAKCTISDKERQWRKYWARRRREQANIDNPDSTFDYVKRKRRDQLPNFGYPLES